jgi:hypothetical protein
MQACIETRSTQGMNLQSASFCSLLTSRAVVKHFGAGRNPVSTNSVSASNYTPDRYWIPACAGMTLGRYTGYRE